MIIAPRFVFLSSRAKRPTGRLFWSPPRRATMEQNLRFLELNSILAGPEGGPGRSGFSVVRRRHVNYVPDKTKRRFFPLNCTRQNSKWISWNPINYINPETKSKNRKSRKRRPVSSVKLKTQKKMFWKREPEINSINPETKSHFRKKQKGALVGSVKTPIGSDKNVFLPS